MLKQYVCLSPGGDIIHTAGPDNVPCTYFLLQVERRLELAFELAEAEEPEGEGETEAEEETEEGEGEHEWEEGTEAEESELPLHTPGSTWGTGSPVVALKPPAPQRSTADAATSPPPLFGACAAFPASLGALSKAEAATSPAAPAPQPLSGSHSISTSPMPPTLSAVTSPAASSAGTSPAAFSAGTSPMQQWPRELLEGLEGAGEEEGGEQGLLLPEGAPHKPHTVTATTCNRQLQTADGSRPKLRLQSLCNRIKRKINLCVCIRTNGKRF